MRPAALFFMYIGFGKVLYMVGGRLGKGLVFALKFARFRAFFATRM